MPVILMAATGCRGSAALVRVSGNGFPSFLPKEVERIRDRHLRELAKRIQRIPVKFSFSKSSIMSSCVKPVEQHKSEPVVLLHSFDSSCLEWRYAYPLLEDSGLETWAVDILGWGFSDLKMLPSSGVVAKREHLYQLWRSHIQRPMVLVGPSLGAAVAIDFVVNHPEAVTRLVLIDASVYAEGTGILSKLPRALAYAGVSLLKSTPLRFYASKLAFKKLSLSQSFDWTNATRLHCLLPWWEDAMVDFMVSGGYNVRHQIKQVKQKTLIIWGEDDKLICSELALKLHEELSNSILHKIPNCGHFPHVEKPEIVAEIIFRFVRDTSVNGKPVPSVIKGDVRK
ncbi:hypothetical protein KFK09_005913 [Dendrobium nobile]|uniref:AB hydrolase-1 domain-containing protein n=1 Tax=Dendrobium nobile TaxID=94219 RepID=A0A8T3C0J2_DENNO|nr:hypothetical protein KFK09_005913 [Dendrobium nobile]